MKKKKAKKTKKIEVVDVETVENAIESEKSEDLEVAQPEEIKDIEESEDLEAQTEEIVEKTVLPSAGAEYSDQEIKDFKKECGERPSFTIKDFEAVLLKESDELTYTDMRILISKIGWLSDDERLKFAEHLYRENLTEAELERYGKIYPHGMKFDKYFPSKTKGVN